MNSKENDSKKELCVEFLPKGDLHVHLNGLISKAMMQDILHKEKSFYSETIDINPYLEKTKPYKSLQEYIRIWDVFRLVPNHRSSLKLMMEDAFINLKKDNVRFAEIRNSVIYISLLNDITVTEALRWLLEYLDVFSEKYGIKAGFIPTVSRGDYCIDNFKALLKAYEALGCPKSIVGIDLAGDEDYQCPKELAKLFRVTKEKYNLKITIHAGETGNPNNIRDAIINYGADRIGHGTAASKSKEVMQLLKEKDICIEVCPISNYLTGAVKSLNKHPVSDFIKNNVPFVICSDNPGFHDASLSEDYKLFINAVNDSSQIENMFDKQKKYTFIKGLQ
ncbi:MAG: adenosine deaminase [Planctomycetes bacterium GWF2_42_9]|nr:MAG: adenosine deaminase [Planctomycetes bacterium GWF2_42_9]